jgi:hypothetical protein
VAQPVTQQLALTIINKKMANLIDILFYFLVENKAEIMMEIILMVNSIIK